MPCRSLTETLDALAALDLRFDRLRLSPAVGGYQVVIELAFDPVWVVGLGPTTSAAFKDAAARLNARLNPPRSMFD